MSFSQKICPELVLSDISLRRGGVPGLSEGGLVSVFVLVIWPISVIMTCGWRGYEGLPS
jgi:hypothetical protein